MFGTDGSIYIPFPYLETKRGILSEADPPTEPDPKTIHLLRNGIIVDYDVKFSHHTSGVMHFSKSGQTSILPRRRSFPLDGPIGRLFDFRTYWLRGFTRVSRSERRRDLHLSFSYPNGHPMSLHVWAEWRRKADIVANIDPRETAETIIGPHPVMVDRRTGHEQRAILLGQPSSSPLRDHVMMIFAEETSMAAGADSSTAIFTGGWDVHEDKAPDTARMLAFMYPVVNHAPQRRRVSPV